jgi:hypothetical protein
MSKHRKARADYQIGYAKPPKATQFKTGNKAARGPRKKARLDQINEMLEEVLTAPVLVRVQNRQVKMPAIRAIFVQARNSALKGDDRGIKQVFDFIERRGLAGRPQDAEEKFREEMKGIGEKLRLKLQKAVANDRRQQEEEAAARPAAASKSAEDKK